MVVNSRGGGIAKLSGNTWTVYNTSNSQLPHNSVFEITFDQNNNLWIATMGGGTAKLSFGLPPLKISISSSDAHCGKSDGSATVVATGGSKPYKYVWTNGDTTDFTDSLISGLYAVMVIDSVGNTLSSSMYINNLSAPSINVVSVTPVSCKGGINGAISIAVSGGQLPYSYEWSNGDSVEDIGMLSAGFYDLTLLDKSGCKTYKTFEVTEPDSLMIAISVKQPSCGNTDGMASVLASGGTAPYTYLWSNDSVNSSITNVPAGPYTIVITDSNGCKDSAMAAISESNAPEVVVDSTTLVMCGDTLGEIYITVTGGTQPYTYLWSDSSTVEDLTGTPKGDYTCVVTGSNNCSSVISASIGQIGLITPEICIVTVDAETQRNKIIWERTHQRTVAHYNIYRETSQPGKYIKIGQVPADQSGVYIDMLANSKVRSWRYKISVVDSCNNESALSSYHKTMHMSTSQGLGGSYNMMWDNYEGISYDSYYIYRYTNSNSWELLDSLPNTLHSYSDFPAYKDNLYYKVVIQKSGSCDPDKSGITESASNYGITNYTTSIDDVSGNEDIVVYPNPASNRISFSGINDHRPVEIFMYNAYGLLVVNSILSSMNGLDVSALNKGVYMYVLKTSDNKRIALGRLVIE